MENIVVEKFITLWRNYFDRAELPIVCFYSDDAHGATAQEKGKGAHCLIATLTKVRRGEAIFFDAQSVNCHGGRRYLGFADTINDRFNYFLSDGSDGGFCERYKKTPQMVEEFFRDSMPLLHVTKKNIIFKRWDTLTEQDSPELVTFFATPDVLSGLFTLVAFDNNDLGCVVAPFSSGCGSMVCRPYFDFVNGVERATLGMFDPSARKCVKENVMTFTVPLPMLLKMMGNMDSSFLTTPSWDIIKKRIARGEERD